VPGVETASAIVLVLRPFARQIARMSDPGAVAPIAPERSFDHAAPSIQAARSYPSPQATAARTGLGLPAHRTRRFGSTQGAHPPRHQPPRPASLAGFKPPELQPGLLIATRLPR